MKTMTYDTEINGIQSRVWFDEENISGLFLPLLRRLTQLKKQKGGRVLAFLAAPPGAGKSTLLSFLKELSERTEGCEPVMAIGMDGFHRYQDYLLTHTTVRGGEEIPMVKVKGAPETFDLERLAERIRRVAAGEACGWPEYDRMLHNPRENAVRIDGDLVLLEGNYLLLDRPGWKDLKAYADYTVRLEADEEFLRQRLIARRIRTGVDAEEAARFVDYSDMANVRLCLRESVKADQVWRVDENGFAALAEETVGKEHENG